MKLHSFLELTCSHLRFMLFNLGRDRNVIGCSVHVCELSWTMSDGDLTTSTLDHLRDLSESDTLHADTWPFWARGYPRLFLCNACELGMRISQTWSGIGLLSLLLRCWWSSPFGVLSGGCSFVIMLIKALVTSPAFALGMTPCHTGLSGTYGKLFTFAPFLRPTTTRRTLSVGVATTIAFGGCSFSVLRTTGLVLFCNAVTVLPQPFSVDQIFHGMMEKLQDFSWAFSDARSKASMSYFSNWLGRICLRRISLSTASSGVVAIPARVASHLLTNLLKSWTVSPTFTTPKDLRLCKGYLLLLMFWNSLQTWAVRIVPWLGYLFGIAAPYSSRS